MRWQQMEQSNRSSHNDAQIQRLARDKEDGLQDAHQWNEKPEGRQDIDAVKLTLAHRLLGLTPK
jgi:hypothetical protein